MHFLKIDLKKTSYTSDQEKEFSKNDNEQAYK